ncbi:CBS domain-containing protein [Natrarchaeobius oligotrophus]|uniref:CBS domain-containing protein n=2 Tax=Natrarchaeobius TaxID=2501796 RepID=A0A3N6MBV7_NATCH|nr:CBS domain-containing protein [Natrarchaeobius chitinivorans]
MSSPLETISKNATVQDAAKRMRDEEISALVVTTDPPSIVTSTDVLTVAADGRNAGDVPVTDVMTESVETVPPDIYLEEVAAMLTTFGIKHLPVTNNDDEYVGMVSSTDVTAQLS